MSGWTIFCLLVFSVISAMRDEPITLGRCSWFWNWNRFGFSLHPPHLLWSPKCSSKGSWQNFSKEESEHFLLLSVAFQLRQMTLLKLKNSDEVDFFNQTFITCKVRLASKKVNFFCSIWDHLGQFEGPWPEHFEDCHADLVSPQKCANIFMRGICNPPFPTLPVHYGKGAG